MAFNYIFFIAEGDEAPPYQLGGASMTLGHGLMGLAVDCLDLACGLFGFGLWAVWIWLSFSCECVWASLEWAKFQFFC